ncbi:hypothetical protein PVA45_01365 [Entomospira entomophila]|uniref:DUF4340 domain-containing protein n=1 Tax=Entomospira entomophila TaxID=2719988 RepID=A0A968KQY3_9SPIO|nr:hypothetical protein [Entomospira entomophilus]NIZ40168.1 hypothetical protein [Entomospira entomophilus]WDI35726.1 hypothetical protein PVA45_01365 [Entomospira entomophilus]
MSSPYKKLTIVSVIVIILIIIGKIIYYHQHQLEDNHTIWGLSPKGQPIDWTFDANQMHSIIIEQCADNQTLTFIQNEKLWKLDGVALPIHQSKVLRIIDLLKTTSVTYLSRKEISEPLQLKPMLSVSMIDSNGLKQSLIIADFTPTGTSHYAYLTDTPEEIFMIDVISVEILSQSPSQYYDILLSELNTNAVKQLQLTNTHGELMIVKKINNEFFSNYEFIYPFKGYAVSQQAFSSEFLNLWMGRTPISIVNYYEPSASTERMKEVGLNNPQAILHIEHIDGSSFDLAVGLKADEFHFYARELSNNDIWLIPSDLANSLLHLKPFDWLMRSLMLPNISHTASIKFHNYLSQNTLEWKSANTTEQESRNLYETLLALQYNQVLSDVAITDTSTTPAYKISWNFKNQEEKHIIFTKYNERFFYITIDGIITPFLIEQYQIRELERVWIRYSQSV